MDRRSSDVADGAGRGSFLGDVSQVCVVTSHFMKTVQSFVQIGISPWRLMRLGPHNMTDQVYRGQPAEYQMRVGLAKCGRTEWEVIEPISGPSIHQDWLAAQGDGVHHVLMRSREVNFDDRLRLAEDRGLRCVQSGNWGGIRFAYLDTNDMIGAFIELVDIPADLSLPEPDEWYPYKPA